MKWSIYKAYFRACGTWMTAFILTTYIAAYSASCSCACNTKYFDLTNTQWVRTYGCRSGVTTLRTIQMQRQQICVILLLLILLCLMPDFHSHVHRGLRGARCYQQSWHCHWLLADLNIRNTCISVCVVHVMYLLGL